MKYDYLLTNIRVQMALRSWKQNDLAERSKISGVTISRLLGGKIKSPSLQTIQRIADAFGCSMEILVAVPGDLAASKPHLNKRRESRST
jgi:transcriptional regulator with XRE-family HTH domain